MPFLKKGEKNAHRRISKQQKSKKKYKVTDCGGLYVNAAISGAVTFRYDYRINGRRATYVMGKYGRGGVSLLAAREQCLDARRLVVKGESPVLEKYRAKRKIKETTSYSQFGKKWLEDSRMADSTRKMRSAIFIRDILPAFDSRLLKEIKPDDLRQLDAKADYGSLRADLRQYFSDEAVLGLNAVSVSAENAKKILNSGTFEVIRSYYATEHIPLDGSILSTEKHDGVIRQHVQFRGFDREWVTGTLAIPADAKNPPIVLLLHGITQSKDQWWSKGGDYSFPSHHRQVLIDNGIAVFAIDARNHGERIEKKDFESACPWMINLN